MCISGVNDIYDFSAVCFVQNGGFKMLETIIIVVCAAVCIGAAGFAWWMENGPDKGNDIKDDVKIHNENQNLN